MSVYQPWGPRHLTPPQRPQEMRVQSAPSTRSPVSGDGSVSPPTAAPQLPAALRLNQQPEQTQPYLHKPQPQRAFVFFSPEICSAVRLYNLWLISWALEEKLNGWRLKSSSGTSLWHPLIWGIPPSSPASKAACPSCCHCPQVRDEGRLLGLRDPQVPAPYTYQTSGSGPTQVQTQAEMAPELCAGDNGLPEVSTARSMQRALEIPFSW